MEGHIDSSRALLARPHIHRREIDLLLGEDLGDIHQQAGTVVRVYTDADRIISAVLLRCPFRLDQAAPSPVPEDS